MSSRRGLAVTVRSMFRIKRINPTWLGCDAATDPLSIYSNNIDRVSERKGLFASNVSLMLRVSDPACLERENSLISVISLSEGSGTTTDPGVN